MQTTVVPPTKGIAIAADLLEEAIHRLLRALASCRPVGKYESDVEAYNLLRLTVRHVEAVMELARHDLVLLPSAMTIARAAFESAIKLLWMLDPVDPFEREVRWLAQLQTEEAFHSKMAAQLSKMGHGQAQAQMAEIIRDFHLGVAGKLPSGYTPLKQIPNLYQMLETLGEERKYLLYVITCQYAHGTHGATSLYRKNLGIDKAIGEFVAARDWWPCLSIAWYSLHASGERFLDKTGGELRQFLSPDFGTAVQAAVDASGSE